MNLNFRLIATLVLILFVFVFALQNAQMVEIKLLFWQLEFPRSLLIFLMLLIGIVIGWFSRAMWKVSRNRD